MMEGEGKFTIVIKNVTMEQLQAVFKALEEAKGEPIKVD